MPPKSKKAPKNAFSFFLQEYVESERKRGRDVSLRIAAEECSSAWTELAKEEKTKYENLASKFKVLNKSEKEKKFTSLGISFAEVERQQKEIQEGLEKADEEIKLTISKLDGDKLINHMFYIVHCNYYCRTEAGVYVPAELAISEFSLKTGINRTFHTLINPGSIPLGFAFEAKKSIEDIHGLPYPPYEEGDSDYSSILKNVLKFLKPGTLPNGRIPPLYSIQSNIMACDSILQALADSSPGAAPFRVFYLHKMFFWLKNKCIEDLETDHYGFPVVASAESEISKDAFCYVPGLSCSFHLASDDKYQNCSLSVVQRFVYVICDHCCQYVEVPLVPGKHCRLCTDVNRLKKNLRKKNQELYDDGFDGQSSYRDDENADNEEAGASSLDLSQFQCHTNPMTPHSSSSKANENERGSKAREKKEERELDSSSDDDVNEETFARMMSLGRGVYRR